MSWSGGTENANQKGASGMALGAKWNRNFFPECAPEDEGRVEHEEDAHALRVVVGQRVKYRPRDRHVQVGDAQACVWFRHSANELSRSKAPAGAGVL